MNHRKTPDLACVTVSTTETSVTNWDVNCPLDMEDQKLEQLCLHLLVKRCGWYWRGGETGILRKKWRAN